MILDLKISSPSGERNRSTMNLTVACNPCTRISFGIIPSPSRLENFTSSILKKKEKKKKKRSEISSKEEKETRKEKKRKTCINFLRERFPCVKFQTRAKATRDPASGVAEQFLRLGKESIDVVMRLNRRKWKRKKKNKGKGKKPKFREILVLFHQIGNDFERFKWQRVTIEDHNLVSS